MALPLKIAGEPDIPAAWRASSLGAWLRRAALGGPPLTDADAPPLLVGLCPHDAPRPPLSEERAFLLDCAGPEFVLDDFSVSHAVAVGGARAVVLLGCRLCRTPADPVAAEARRLRSLFPKVVVVGAVHVPDEGLFLIDRPDA